MEKRNYLVFSTYPLSFLLLWWARNYPQQLEHLYGERLYPFLKEARLGIFDFLPFSFGDFFYTALSFYAIGLIKTGIHDWKKGCIQLFAALGILLLWFQLSWGLHYYRPMASNNKAVRYTEDELFKTAEQLAHHQAKHQIGYHAQDGIAGQSGILDRAEMIPVALGRVAQAEKGHDRQVARSRGFGGGLAHPGDIAKQS